MRPYYIIHDRTTAMLPSYQVTVETTTGEGIDFHFRALDKVTAALEVTSYAQQYGITVRQVLRVESLLPG